MPRDYTFERREVDGSSSVVADPVSGDDDPVELASTWGAGRVSRSTAVDALVGTLDEEGPVNVASSQTGTDDGGKRVE